ncbi:MAG: peptide chain release factor N(5)-glutamine methyltransferase [Spirochaetales bacterium]|nr:peptide chain release factor N(5)-glutamine methyltransferase [Spirochaetales bacterium]
MTVQEAKLFGRNQLLNSPTPDLDTQVLLSHVTGLTKTQLLFKRETVLTQEQEKKFLSFVEKRKTRLPVAYITGHKEFFGYDFTVTPSVLIPKPDTEILVEQGINAVKEKLHLHNISICDMCTGSGCVGISILKYCIQENILSRETAPSLVLADISENALDIARQNASLLLEKELLEKVSFVRTNLFQNINSSFDIIVSNPPYIPEQETAELLQDGRMEPALALNGDVTLQGNPSSTKDGLAVMRNLVKQAVFHLNTKGILLCESGEYNALETQQIFLNNGLEETEVFRDLEGQLRVTKGTCGCQIYQN